MLVPDFAAVRQFFNYRFPCKQIAIQRRDSPGPRITEEKRHDAPLLGISLYVARAHRVIRFAVPRTLRQRSKKCPARRADSVNERRHERSAKVSAVLDTVFKTARQQVLQTMRPTARVVARSGRETSDALAAKITRRSTAIV
ncbi:hypothetical protein [Paraburkholderia sp.]|jgi:hypothetical protein|uniref:hypothetical protein n=1 Tax=Paraburkholderia sp. TaxID=1926495 RepID=UPI002F41DCFA